MNPVVPVPPVSQSNTFEDTVTGPSVLYAERTLSPSEQLVLCASTVSPFAHGAEVSPDGTDGESLQPGSRLAGLSEQPAPVL